MSSFAFQEFDPVFDLPKLGPLLTIDDFTPHVGKTFMVEATPQPIGILLEKIQADAGESWMQRQPFLLVFSTPWEVLLIEANYLMRPEGEGPGMEMYMIPTQSAPGARRYYQVIFN